MAQSFGEGDQIVIVASSSVPPRQIAGVHTGTRGELIAVAVQSDDDQLRSLAPGEPVVVVRNGPGGRSAARGSFVRFDEDGAWFHVPGNPWQVVEEPRRPRIVLNEECEVVGATLGERVRGTIMDISEGGARISVPQHVGESRLDLKFIEGTQSVSVPTVLLACIKSEAHSELRVRFDKLTRPQELAVRRYVERWVKEKKAS